MLSVAFFVMLIVVIIKRRYAECRYVQCRYSVCRYGMSFCYMLLWSKLSVMAPVVEHSTRDHEVKGSNPAAVWQKEKMAEKKLIN